MSMKTIIILFSVLFSLMFMIIFYEKHYGYEYINFYNEHGLAEKCKIADTENEFRGLLCKVDGHWIEVKQYGKR